MTRAKRAKTPSSMKLKRSSRTPVDRCPASPHTRGERAIAWLTLFSFFVSPATALADTTHTAVGNATTNDGHFVENTDARTTFDQDTRNAVVQWDVMDQQADNTLTFIQNSGESVLNQASGIQMSVFRGMVVCEANCVFANEAGILRADGSYLDVGGMVADIAGTVDEDAFRAGELHATGLDGVVENLGTIHAGSALLAGARVLNRGEIVIEDGALSMVVGDEIWLRNHDSNVVIRAVLPESTTRAATAAAFDGEPAIENSGNIDAGDGAVRMLAGDMLSYAIRNTGRIRAREIQLEGGAGSLVEVAGDALLDASATGEDEFGGAIDVLGDYVAIADRAVLDASGGAGGGRIRVGGARAGGGETRTAKQTYVGRDTTLRADATHDGDGGEIIVWSDGTTQSHGTISAQGGWLGGNGGFVETSGRAFLDVTSSPLVSTRSGRSEDRGGDWLLDPFNIDIVAGAGDLDDQLGEDPSYDPELVFSPTVQASADDATSEIDVALLKQALASGANVTLTTSGSGNDDGTQEGDIRLLTDLTFSDGDALPDTEASLILLAADDIVIDGRIDAVDSTPVLALSLDFRANAEGQDELADVDGQLPADHLGDLTLNADVETGGGAVNFTGANVNLNADITTEGGGVTVLAEGGDATLAAGTSIDTDVTLDMDTRGGDVLVGAFARVVEDPDDADREIAVGGDVLGEAGSSITTDGGSVTLSGGDRAAARRSDAAGGSVFYEGAIDSGTGNVILEASRTLPANDSLNETGVVELGDAATIQTDRASVTLDAFVDPASQERDDARTIVRLLGDIDTDSVDAADDQAGGNVEIRSDGFVFARVEIGDSDAGDRPDISTNGGDIFVESNGSIDFVEGTLDASYSGTPDPEADPISGDILLDARGRMSIRPEADDVIIAADDNVILSAGGDGVARLSFDTTVEGTGNITVSADAIQLNAGDGFGGQNAARISFADSDASLQFSNSAGDANPLDLTISQDANLDVADIPAANQFQSGSFDVENLTLRSNDGELDLGGLTATASDTMTFGAREGIDVSSPTILSADTLEIESYEALTIDSDLATAIDDADARVVEITAGALGTLLNAPTEDIPETNAHLIVAADLDLADGGETSEAERLVLRGGAGGSGDLLFSNDPTLSAHEIVLWAGDGGTTGESSRVVAIEDGTSTVDFAFGSAAAPEFTLRQAATIDNDAIPDVTQFAGGVDGVRYNLRSDGGQIGGDDPIQTSKLTDTFLALHARDGILADFATGMTDATLQVRGLDIGGTQAFTYTRTHNDQITLSDGVNPVVLTIRAGLSGTGDLSFDGSPEEGDDTAFEIVADEIRLVAGDGLAGNNQSRIVLDRDAEHKPVFKGAADDQVDLFVFRQDAPIDSSTIATSEDFFEDRAPDVHVIHSDYDSVADGNTAFAAIEIDASDAPPTADSKLILSGERVAISSADEQDLALWSHFSETEGDPFELEVRADLLDLRASDLNDEIDDLRVLFEPDAPAMSNTTFTFTDFERFQTEDEAEAFTPIAFDAATTPNTVPNTVSFFQEATITRAQLTALRGALNNADLTVHDGDPDDPDDAAMDLFLESLEGDVEVAASSVNGSALFITLHNEGATVDWDRSVPTAYDLERLVVGADHSFVFGSSADAMDLDVTVAENFQLRAGLGGRDGDISFESGVTITANQVALQAGESGELAEDGELPAVDLTTNMPTFVLVDSDDSDDGSDSIFEVRQDAGFVDDIADAGDGESLIIDPSQLSGGAGPDEFGVIRLISEGGSIQVRNLSTTFQGANGGGLVSRLELQASTVDVLRGGVIELADEAGGDTDLTLYDSVDLSAREIILRADGNDIVRADDPDVLFRASATSLGEGLRFRIEHDGSAIDGSTIASIDQFIGSSLNSPVAYELVATNAGVEITSELAAKLRGGTNEAPNLVNLFVNGNDIMSDADVVISAQDAGRAVDAQFASLVIGELHDEARIRFDGTADPTAISTTGDQTYHGDVEIDGAAVLTGDTFDFSSDIRSDDPAVEANLTLNVREEVIFGGNIDLVRDAAGPESVLRVNLDPSQSDVARVSFDNDGVLQMVSADRVEFFGTREADLDEATGFVPDNARESSTATIGKRSGDLHFDVTRFRMAEGEKMSVGGALSIGDAGTLLAALGDLSAVTIDVVADRIVLLLRAAGDYIGFDGRERRDSGVDYVANTISFDGEIETSGSGRAPVFGLENPYAEHPDLEGFLLVELEPNGGQIRASDFNQEFDGGIPDLHPEGATRDDYSNIFDTRLTDPSVVTAFATHLGDPQQTVQDALLSRIDIAVEPDRTDALRSRVEGAGIVDDVGGDLPTRADRRVKVSTSRILARDAQAVADRHLRLFGENDSKAEEVRAILQKALDDYLLESGARRVLGFEFRRYLRNRPSSQFDAYLALEDLDALFSYHRNLGLTPGEYTRVQSRWLATIKPEGISLEQFAEAIHPSRFVRGSDILDVFGD